MFFVKETSCLINIDNSLLKYHKYNEILTVTLIL